MIYLTQLYTPLQALTNAPVDFAQSIVSFERVFEIIDLPLEIAEERDGAVHLDAMSKAELIFERCRASAIRIDEGQLLSDVERIGRFASVAATRSGESQPVGLRTARRLSLSAHQARDKALEKHHLPHQAGAAHGRIGRPQRRRQDDADLFDSSSL